MSNNQNSKNQLRPCIVDGRRAMFHRLANRVMCIRHSDTYLDMLQKRVVSGGSYDEQKNTFYAETVALIEFEDGSVEEVIPSKVRFVDGGGFGAVNWPE